MINLQLFIGELCKKITSSKTLTHKPKDASYPQTPYTS